MNQGIKHITFLLIKLATILLFTVSAFAAEEERLLLPPEQAQQLRHFSDALYEIKRNYVDPVDDKKLVGACLRGMVGSLDAESSYFDENDFEEMIKPSGTVGSVGLMLSVDGDFIRVITAFEGSPAYSSGILNGDLLVMIDDKSTRGMKVAEAEKRLHGKLNTSVTLTITRQGELHPISFVLKRKVIRIEPIRSLLLEAGYAYVRIGSFHEATLPNLAKHLKTIYKNNQIKGLILDLRDNPGGILSDAIGVATAFLPRESLVLSSDGRTSDAKHRFLATSGEYGLRNRDHLRAIPAAIKTVPMVVLINERTVAGAEIVAGALQDYKRAILLGNNTFGRGSIQTILLPSPNTAIKLTTARWYTPTGRSVQPGGLVPDMNVSEKEGQTRPSDVKDDYQVQQGLSVLKSNTRE